MEMPVTPVFSPPPPPLFFPLLSHSSDFSHPSATGGGSFSARLLCPFSLFFQPLLSAGNLPLLPSALLRCFLLLPACSPCPNPLHPFPSLCVEKRKIFEGSLLLLTSSSASTCESLFSVFFSHLSSSVSRQRAEVSVE